MAEWDAAYVNDLPDSAFAIILPGGSKDEEGKTTPRSLRKLPHHNAAGDVDLPHLRNALSRESQTDLSASEHAKAEKHLQSHADAELNRAEDDEPHILDLEDAEVTLRSESQREIDVVILPWDSPINHVDGREVWRRGTFDESDPSKVLLGGLDHERRLTADSHGRAQLTPHVTGRGTRYWDDERSAKMTFKVANTAAGDEILGLARDGLLSGVSVEVQEVPGGSRYERLDGRRTKVYTKALLTGVSPTAARRPAFKETAILAVRSEHEGEPVPEELVETTLEATPVQPVVFDTTPLITHFDAAMSKLGAQFDERLGKVEEQYRSSFAIPAGGSDEPPLPSRSEWMEVVLKMMSGEKIPDRQYAGVADVISSDNIGVVPPAYLSELIGVIDPSRPFLSSTRRLPTPTSGMQLVVPVLTQRPTVAEQTQEKAELSSQETKITTQSFDMVSKGGVGDISLQLLKRADRSFLDLYLQLLAEAYAIEAESEAVVALVNAMGGFSGGNPLDPENLSLGTAYTTAFDAIRRPPDTIWLSTEAVGAFIDAKATTTNQPLYSTLQASATAGGGITGTISGLRAVHVPVLDSHGAFAIVGPSSGFAWAEDGTYTLAVDVPSKAGRDVALFGMLWFAPWYPDAFSLYNVAS